MALLTASTFNKLTQCASSFGTRFCCYAELTISSLVVAITVVSTCFTYPRNILGGLVKYKDDRAERTVTHLSTKPA